MDKEELTKECRSGWLAVESDFNARLEKPEMLKYEIIPRLFLALQVMGRNPSEGAIERYWAQAGSSLSYQQFCLVMKREKKTSMNDLMRAFRKIDSDGDGFITAQELHRKLTKRGEKMSSSEVQAIIAEADLNGDGKLDYSEFCLMLNSTSNECIQANYMKSSQPLQSHATSPSKLERHGTHLYSSGGNEPTTAAGTHSNVNGSGQSDLEAFLAPLSEQNPRAETASASFFQDVQIAEMQPREVPMAAEAKKDDVPRALHDLSNKLPPLKKVSLPSLQEPPSGSVEDTDSCKIGTGNRKGSYGEAGDSNVACLVRNPEKETGSSRQTDHLREEQPPLVADDTMEHTNGDVGTVASGNKQEVKVPPLSMAKGDEGQEFSGSRKEGELEPGCKREEERESLSTGSKKEDPVQEQVAHSSVVAPPPPRKPKDVESWNSISGKGCFCLELDAEGEESEIKSHRYNLTLPAPTNVWVEMGVASPGIPEADALLLIFRTNEEEEITDLITYTQHKMDNQWVCRMDLDAGTYALIPFTSGCHLKPLEDTCPTHVALTYSKDDVSVLTSECLKILEEIFHRVDLDNNGCISRTEFDFFQEVTSGEICDDEAWNIILTNFDVTEEEEITLKGFLTLHEMAAADEEGGEEELRQVVSGMGYDKQLLLNKACPFSFEVLTEDCEGEIEIIDLLPFAPVANAAFSELAVERGVVQPVKGGEKGDIVTHTFTTPHMTALVVENKTAKRTYVQLDCSQSVNCIPSRESAVHVVEVAANSNAIGYFFLPVNASEPYSVFCTASKILA